MMLDRVIEFFDKAAIIFLNTFGNYSLLALILFSFFLFVIIEGIFSFFRKSRTKKQNTSINASHIPRPPPEDKSINSNGFPPLKILRSDLKSTIDLVSGQEVVCQSETILVLGDSYIDISQEHYLLLYVGPEGIRLGENSDHTCFSDSLIVVNKSVNHFFSMKNARFPLIDWDYDSESEEVSNPKMIVCFKRGNGPNRHRHNSYSGDYALMFRDNAEVKKDVNLNSLTRSGPVIVDKSDDSFYRTYFKADESFVGSVDAVVSYYTVRSLINGGYIAAAKS